MDIFKKINLKQYGMIIALVLITVLFQILTDGVLLRPINVNNLVLQNSYILILAIGMLLVIVTGNIDLSVGSVAGFAGALGGILIVSQGWPVWLAVIIVLATGGIVGAWHGFWISYKKIPAFIVTLAGMLVFRGLTMAILGGQTIAPFPSDFQIMASGFLSDYIDMNSTVLTLVVTGSLSVVFIVLDLRARKKQQTHDIEVVNFYLWIVKVVIILGAFNGFGLLLGAHAGIPIVLILVAILAVIYQFITTRTIMGRHIYAYGGNSKAAELTGLKTKQLVFWVYVNMGVLAALAGLIFTARLNAATPRAGTNFELEAIAAAFIGGASPMGGVGKVWGAIIGALVMGILNNGMSILGVGVDYQQAIMGVILLAAVVFDVYTKSKAPQES